MKKKVELVKQINSSDIPKNLVYSLIGKVKTKIDFLVPYLKNGTIFKLNKKRRYYLKKLYNLGYNKKLLEKEIQLLDDFTNDKIKQIQKLKSNKININLFYISDFLDLTEKNIEHIIKLNDENLIDDYLYGKDKLTDKDINNITLLKKFNIIDYIYDDYTNLSKHYHNFNLTLKIIKLINTKGKIIKANKKTIINYSLPIPLNKKQTKKENKELLKIDFFNEKEWKEYLKIKNNIKQKFENIINNGFQVSEETEFLKELEDLFKELKLTRTFKNSGAKTNFNIFEKIPFENKILSMHSPKNLKEMFNKKINTLSGGNCHNYTLIFAEIFDKLNLDYKIYKYGKYELGHSFLVVNINGKYFLIDGYQGYYKKIEAGKEINHGYGNIIFNNVHSLETDNTEVKKILLEFSGENKKEKFLKNIKSKNIAKKIYKLKIKNKEDEIIIEKYGSNTYLEINGERIYLKKLSKLGNLGEKLKKIIYTNKNIITPYEILYLLSENSILFKNKVKKELVNKFDIKEVLDYIL